MIVADSNLLAYLLIPGDHTALAESVLANDPDWAAPLLCRSELRNILATYMRQRRMSLVQAQRTMELAEDILRGREYSVPSDEVIETAASSGLSAYDSEFVVLAKRLKVRLVTTDGAILKSFPSLAVRPERFP